MIPVFWNGSAAPLFGLRELANGIDATADGWSANTRLPLDRGIHPLHLLILITGAAIAAPVLLYAMFLILFLLTPGGFD